MNELPFLLDEKEISIWAFWYCKNINNDPEIKKYIIDSEYSFEYCYRVKDDPEIRKGITEEFWVFQYCYNIKNDVEMARKYFKSNSLIRAYIEHIEYDHILRLRLNDDYI